MNSRDYYGDEESTSYSNNEVEDPAISIIRCRGIVGMKRESEIIRGIGKMIENEKYREKKIVGEVIKSRELFKKKCIEEDKTLKRLKEIEILIKENNFRTIEEEESMM